MDRGDQPSRHSASQPSAKDLKRDSRDRALLSKSGEARRTGGVHAAPWAPADLCRGQVLWREAGLQRQASLAAPHRADYLTPLGTPVLAVADGTVVVAEDLFFEGNAVFIDTATVSSACASTSPRSRCRLGRRLRRARRSAGRSTAAPRTAPVLRIRWHDARINPSSCLRTRRRSRS